MRSISLVALVLAGVGLSGCNLFGGESTEAVAARREADGKAVGGACRHAGRAIEDCYTLNRRAEKASVYAGWREMNDYMRENKLEPVAPQLTPDTALANAAGESAAGESKKGKAADKAGEKPRAKDAEKAKKQDS